MSSSLAKLFDYLVFVLPISWSRRRTVARREHFFRSILNICSTPPDEAATVMGQRQYDSPADMSTAVVDAGSGVLLFTVPANFYGDDCTHTYSLWQIGDQLKIGVLLGGEIDQAPVLDLHREIGRIWHDVPYTAVNKGESTLYEWTFTVPRLYDSWAQQELFVRGTSHCKQRVLRIIHDYAKLKHDGV